MHNNKKNTIKANAVRRERGREREQGARYGGKWKNIFSSNAFVMNLPGGSVCVCVGGIGNQLKSLFTLTATCSPLCT